jgi:hypothetical protein
VSAQFTPGPWHYLDLVFDEITDWLRTHWLPAALGLFAGMMLTAGLAEVVAVFL